MPVKAAFPVNINSMTANIKNSGIDDHDAFANPVATAINIYAIKAISSIAKLKLTPKRPRGLVKSIFIASTLKKSKLIVLVCPK